MYVCYTHIFSFFTASKIPSAVTSQVNPSPSPTGKFVPEPKDPCNPNPCGKTNINTRRYGDNCVCECKQGFFGDPYTGCPYECEIHADCPIEKACIGHKCEDPCADVCGVNAECSVSNHNAVCTCIRNYIGDPFVRCNPPRK